MPLLSISSVTTPSYYYHYQKLNHRISASLVGLVGAKRAMVTASSSKSAGAFTTIKERVSFEKEIKKSKFIAIAGPISDEQSAFSFLSQVLLSFPSQFPPIFTNCPIIIITITLLYWYGNGMRRFLCCFFSSTTTFDSFMMMLFITHLFECFIECFD